ncbi:MAG TPA: nicotinate phosphoribosyltransferase [Candidatus Hydrogenedentes bacterium]|jgi:nicotinate phosphoribosyltransferase|nr:MAG: Nicotinate phosphoribosyltransferase pncB2 [Candidatus Hydrogenedentes bacterium ADurb.Bin170]HNZ48113.1 nicotinate phosphoribosyltransferase [Candidatus Hydrogenedentota bacterium]HOD95632.1 nicotinate phosphoribosyltransferase [Candidatus Hydrogenedentota bacterium]HOH42933.1 nicotinate phosphoribosyltransferase [Candidatus Hydrogenedentota bacterium]HOR51079.1 nicotinate phosphoribosyltransferase [Candidatus Hydrogenedentota bacterium]
MNTLHNPWFQREGLALLTDFYQLTMMAGHWKEERVDRELSFEYFFRYLPPNTGYAIAAGVEEFLHYFEHLYFTESDLEYLRSLKIFDDCFLEYLRHFEKKCTIRCVPEGTAVFPFEPVIQVEGPILEAQLLETALLNIVNYQTLIATKASRICLAADGDPVMEFGLRRAHGPDGGLSASRAAFIGGCHSTSNVLAGQLYGIPVAGTHAHSWVMSFSSELEAFRTFARLYPERCILLVDTYDPVKSGIPNAIRTFCELREQGVPIRPAVRLDSGDLAKLSKICYSMMLQAGLENPLIVASNDLNEDLIADLKRQGARINAWGVGTQLVTAYDAPALPGVYKAVAMKDTSGKWSPVIKTSFNYEKATDPGRKYPQRYLNDEGYILGDVMYSEYETPETGGIIEGRSRKHPQVPRRIENAAQSQPLLREAFVLGKRISAERTAAEIREYAAAQQSGLTEEFKRLRNPERYPILLSPAMGDLKHDLLLMH